MLYADLIVMGITLPLLLILNIDIKFSFSSHGIGQSPGFLKVYNFNELMLSLIKVLRSV